jgi:dUTP pyrophosphatase
VGPIARRWTTGRREVANCEGRLSWSASTDDVDPRSVIRYEAFVNGKLDFAFGYTSTMIYATENGRRPHRGWASAACIPTPGCRRAHPGDAGMDLHAIEPVWLDPGERAAVRTGIAIELPAGHAGWVLPRSGLARRGHGMALVNAPGLIDEGYRGELDVLLLNTDREEASELRAGDRIASASSSPAPRPSRPSWSCCPIRPGAAAGSGFAGAWGLFACARSW